MRSEMQRCRLRGVAARLIAYNQSVKIMKESVILKQNDLSTASMLLETESDRT